MNQTLISKSENRSHYKENQSLDEAVAKIKEQVIGRGDLPHISVDQQLEVLEQLTQFEFGRYMLEHMGANGFWTDYLINYPNVRKMPDNFLNPLENFILNRSILILAHRERFKIYQDLLQSRLKEGVVLSSIPCGLMRDLITLNFSATHNFKLVGLDLDPASIVLAQELALSRGISNSEFYQQDAWKMDFTDEFDVITSSGLNVYESDPNKVLDLYKRFYKALKPGGALIISVLTYPPGESCETDWDLNGIPTEDLLMERILYKDILDLHWRNFRSSGELEKEFIAAGFSQVSVHFDKHRIFPTIFAQKA